MDRTLLFRVMVLLGLLALVSCTPGDAVTDLQADAPTWTGVIAAGPETDVPDPPGTAFWIDVNPPGSGVQVGVIVRSDTEIGLRDDGGFRTGTTAGLSVGQDVRVWTRRGEYLSTPPMYDARRIEVW